MTSVGAEPHGHDLLSDDERTHAAGFTFDEDRFRWTTSRVLLHMVLGRYLEQDPKTVELTTAARGRPVIRRPLGSDWLSFSHTRSDRLCVVGITRGPRIGVDVERVRGGLDVVSIARRAFGDAVAGRLDATPSDRRTDEFFRIWVHEEAKGKCRGIGLVEPDDAQPPPLFVADLALRDGYAAALASDAEPETVLGCTAEL